MAQVQSMKRLFVVGGNGLAREIHLILRRHSRSNVDFEFGGFLGHAGYGSTVDYKNVQHLYKGEVADFRFEENDYCIIGSGISSIRKKIYHDLKEMGAKLYNFICDETLINESVTMGEGNILISTAMTVNIKIGHANLFNGHVGIGHDCQIGDFNFFGPRSQVLGAVTVGNENSIGTNGILLPNAKIGNRNKIAPLSAVYRGCKDNGYYLGNPAMKIGDAETAED